MKLIQQPPFSHMCGHACVAMLVGTTVGRVKSMLGTHYGLKWEELNAVLHIFGILCAPIMLPCFCKEDTPPVCLLMLPTASPAIKHWVLKYGDTIYDPGRVVPYPVDELVYPLVPASLVLRSGEITNVQPPMSEEL